MEYSALELKGSGSLNKSQFLSTSDYTFFLYRVPNQTGASPNLSGSGYFTFETKRNALGNYSGSTSYINGASLNPSVANSSNTASFGVKTLVSSSFIFSYNLFETTNSIYSATSSFQISPGSNIPLNSVYFRATGDYEMEVQPETQTCGVQQEYQGGQSYPTHLQSILGSGTGNPILTPGPRSIPDRWRVDWNGSNEIDTGYISTNPTNYDDVDSLGRANFTNSLQGKVIPEGPITVGGDTFTNYPVGGGIETGVSPNIIRSDGYPQVSAISTYTFSKDSSTSIADVFIYGPMDNTLWDSTLSCP